MHYPLKGLLMIPVWNYVVAAVAAHNIKTASGATFSLLTLLSALASDGIDRDKWARICRSFLSRTCDQ